MITRKTLYKKLYKTNTAVLTSKFGSPRPGGRTHKGEDSDDITGNNPRIYMPFYGVVTKVRNTLSDDRGKYIEIKFQNYYLLCQHLQSISVVVGQRVPMGKFIALQGGSGHSGLTQYASHLHYEFAKYPMGDSRRVSLNPASLTGFYNTFIEKKYPVKQVVVSDLNIRTGPGLNFPTTGKHAPSGSVRIFQTVLKDGYYWGKIDWALELWVALRTADGKRVYVK